MPTINEVILQSYLIEAQQNFTKFLSSNDMPSVLSLHLSPDSCWIAVEHEHRVEFDKDTGEKLEFIDRKSPACHHVIVKL